MTSVDIISNFLGRLELWIYDNIGSGDGTQHIREIWRDDPQMADHLSGKWLEKAARARVEAGPGADSTAVQRLALIDFLTSLDARNHAVFIQWIAENGRPKY